MALYRLIRAHRYSVLFLFEAEFLREGRAFLRSVRHAVQ